MELEATLMQEWLQYANAEIFDGEIGLENTINRLMAMYKIYLSIRHGRKPDLRKKHLDLFEKALQAYKDSQVQLGIAQKYPRALPKLQDAYIEIRRYFVSREKRRKLVEKLIRIIKHSQNISHGHKLNPRTFELYRRTVETYSQLPTNHVIRIKYPSGVVFGSFKKIEIYYMATVTTSSPIP